MVMLDNRARRDDVMPADTTYFLVELCFLYLKLCSIGRLSPTEGKESRMAAAATTHTINKAKKSGQHTVTKPKGP